MRKRLGEILLEDGLITEEQLKQALNRQIPGGKMLGQILKDMGFVTEEQISSALARQES